MLPQKFSRGARESLLLATIALLALCCLCILARNWKPAGHVAWVCPLLREAEEGDWVAVPDPTHPLVCLVVHARTQEVLDVVLKKPVLLEEGFMIGDCFVDARGGSACYSSGASWKLSQDSLFAALAGACLACSAMLCLVFFN